MKRKMFLYLYERVEIQLHAILISALDTGEAFIYLAEKQVRHETGHSPPYTVPNSHQEQLYFYIHT
jgi:hypothetical protein